MYNQYTNFEKQYGDKAGIEDVVIGKRRVQYEEEIEANPKNYDTWFDYAKLEESTGDVTRVREVYERAIAQIPPANEKRYWRRYIYLWINYALYEELETQVRDLYHRIRNVGLTIAVQDIQRTREIYTECLKLIPHKQFTFAKIWLLAAQFEIRQLDLKAARKLLGQAIGMCPKNKLFKGYIELEMQVGFPDGRSLIHARLTLLISSCANLIGVERFIQNIWNMMQRTAQHGSNLQSLRNCLVNKKDAVPSLSWPLANLCWTCQNYYGKRISVCIYLGVLSTVVSHFALL